MTRAERFEGIVLVAILLTVGTLAGAASFTHVHDWTMDNSPAGTPDWFGWANAAISELLPIAALLTIRARRRADKPTRYPMFLLICGVALSLSAQLAVASRASPAGCCPPYRRWPSWACPSSSSPGRRPSTWGRCRSKRRPRNPHRMQPSWGRKCRCVVLASCRFRQRRSRLACRRRLSVRRCRFEEEAGAPPAGADGRASSPWGRSRRIERSYAGHR